MILHFECHEVNIVVTCTTAKTVSAPDDCRLRSVPAGTVCECAAEWHRRLRKHASEAISAADLYSGDHWRIARGICSSRFKIRTWVCSAGYGLVRLTDRITPYSATFSAKHPDSVCRGVSGIQGRSLLSAWWDCLARSPGPSREAPRSLTELVEAYPRSPLIVVAPERYLDAVQDDLTAAAARFPDPEFLMIISAGTKTLGELDRFLIPCDARLQPLVGGIRRTLNIRLARKIVSESRSVPRLADLRRSYHKLLDKQPPLPIYDRRPMTDTQVLAYIRRELRRKADQAHTPLLRKLRGSRFCMRVFSVQRTLQASSGGRQWRIACRFFDGGPCAGSESGAPALPVQPHGGGIAGNRRDLAGLP